MPRRKPPNNPGDPSGKLPEENPRALVPASRPDMQSHFAKRTGLSDPLIRKLPRQREDAQDGIVKVEIAPEDLEGDALDYGGYEDEYNDAAVEADRERLMRRELDRENAALRQRRRKKKRQVMVQRFRMLLKLVFAVGWLMLLWMVARSPLWVLNVPRVTLENNHLISQTQMMPLLRPWLGKPLYQIDTGKLAKDIEARFPIVDHAVVRRQLFPASLHITLSETRPWAEVYVQPPASSDPDDAVKPGDKKSEKPVKPGSKKVTVSKQPDAFPYALMADEKVIALSAVRKQAIELSKMPAVAKSGKKISIEPLVYRPGLYAGQGVQRLILKPSTRYKKAYIDQLHEFVWKAGHISGLHLLWTDARNPNSLVFQYEEVTVHLGKLDDSAGQRLARLVPLVSKIRELSDDIDSVDLRWEKQVTLHTRPGAVFQKPDDKTDG